MTQSNTDPPTVLSRIVRFVRQAGAPSEDSYDRDGFLSWHAESHAAGVGIGIGIMAGATDDYRFAGAIVALLFGLDRGPRLRDPKVVEDLVQEPHYAIGGLALGLVVGVGIGTVT